MRLLFEPDIAPDHFLVDLELVIVTKNAGIPEMYRASGTPSPDRHLLLGLAQGIKIMIDERDLDSTLVHDGGPVRLDLDTERIHLDSDLVIARTTNGRFFAVAPHDFPAARKAARETLRYYTGRIRLDVP